MNFFNYFFKKGHAESDHYDSITGLLNRRNGEQKIKSAMAQASGCLAFIDLDNLKSINDTYGHLAGDHALAAVADVLRAHGKNAIISRIGGDEFLFYMKYVNEAEATSVIQSIMEHFHAKSDANPVLSIASLSIGLCLSAPDSNYTDIYDNADKALYYIKQNGKDNYHFYHQSFHPFKQYPSVDLNRLVESIRKQGAYSGALGVDFRLFTHLYEFINHLAVRYDQNLQLIMITIEPFPSSKEDFTPDILETAMEQMNTAIRTSLRSLDICTRFNSQQFLVILTNAESQNVEMIIQRIFKTFYASYTDTNLQLHYEVAPLKEEKDT